MSIDPEDPASCDPAESGVEDELQDLVGPVCDRSGDRDRHREDDELDLGCGGKLPPDHPDADLFDDLDL